MKIEIPVEVDVDLTPKQIIHYVVEWIYPLLKKHERKGADWCTSRAVVLNDKIYWKYEPTMCGTNCEVQYQEIKIPNEKIFNLCKAAVQLIQAYDEIEEV